MNVYAVIDTNVVVSAMLKKHSIPSAVLKETLSGGIIPVISDEIVEEYREVLHRSKFRFDRDAVETVLGGLMKSAVYIKNFSNITEEIPDPTDAVFYAVTMEVRSFSDKAYLVTGNLRHFPSRYYIVSPREMLEILEEQDLL